MLITTDKPTVAFAKILKFLRFCGTLVGCDIFDPNFHINWVTISVTVLIITYFIFAFYTIAKQFHEDWLILLEASCLSCSVIQGGTKLVVIINDMKNLRNIQAYLDQIYKDYEAKGPTYVKILTESCARVRKVLTIVFVLIIIPAMLMILTPMAMLIITKKRYLMIQFHFPGIDVSTHTGYLLTFGGHSSFIFAGAMGLFGGDLIIIIYMMQAFMFVDIFRVKIEELNALINLDQKRDDREISLMLHDIVKWHQDYLVFTERINSAFYYIVAVIITTSGISIVISLFIILTGDWPGAYPYLLITVYTLYVYCILGTKIEICNDQFVEEIYNIHWYNLTPSQDQVVKLMLLRSQKPSTVYVAGVLPLSVNTALQITKTVYSIFMAMVQFLVE